MALIISRITHQGWAGAVGADKLRGATSVGYPLPSLAPSDTFSIQIAAPSATARVRRPAASAVLAAFDAAQDAGLPSVDCYRAGVEAWRRSHPKQTAAYAGSQAVAINPRRQGQPARRRCMKHRGFNTARPTVANDGGPIEESDQTRCAGVH
jgi:hypothetical protein